MPKPFTVAVVRDLQLKLHKEEVSYSRMCEMMNEIAQDFYINNPNPMSAKEKAKDLMHYYLKELLSVKYSINGFVINELAKQCVSIAVDEIIMLDNFSIEGREYWQQVKLEIQNL